MRSANQRPTLSDRPSPDRLGEDTLTPVGVRRAAARPRIGYYVWRFPSLTAACVHREIGALRRAGLDVEVFADIREPDELLDAESRTFVADTRYVLPIDPVRLDAYRRTLSGGAVCATAAPDRDSGARPAPWPPHIVDHALYLAGHVREYGVTHLHAPWANITGLIVWLAARMAGVPFSVQARASTDLYRNGTRVGLAEMLGAATYVVTNSEFNRAFLEQVVAPPRPIEVIYEGVDPTRFIPPARAALHDPLRILSVGRLSEEKGFEHLVRAVAMLRGRGRRVQCTIVGGADPGTPAAYADRLADCCRGLGMDEVVSFAGAVTFDRVLQEYARADVFVMASVLASDGGRDVTPNALIEAMAMQLPVIAPRMTAIPEIVEDRISGILVPPRNPAALAEALADVADHPSLAAELGNRARLRVEERFDVRKNVRRYLALFAGERR